MLSSAEPPLEAPPVSTAGLWARPFAARADLWALAALVVLAAVIRILVIDTQSFWTDEALTVMEVRSSFHGLVRYITHVETTPPLYFMLIWVWAKVFGSSEAALRSVSTLAGISLVPLAYLCARELASRRAGVLAAALVAINPFMIWYSQEARAYMLLAAFSAAAFLFFLRAQRRPTHLNLALWAGFAALAVMTHFFAGFAIAPQALWLLWRHRAKVGVWAAAAAVGAVQVAMLPFAVSDSSHGVGWIAKTHLVTRVSQTIAEWGVSQLFRRTTNAQDLTAGAILLALILALLLFGRRRGAVGRSISGAARQGEDSLRGPAGPDAERGGVALAAWVAGFALLVPLALVLVGQDFFISRNVIPAFIPLVTVIACACTAPRVRLAGGAVAAALLALFAGTALFVQTHPFMERPQWRDLAHSLGDPQVPRAIIAAGGTTADPLEIYLPGARWSQPHGLPVQINEIDVIGARKHFRLLASGLPGAQVRFGSSLPRSVAPRGMRLLIRRRVHTWTIARFVLRRPTELSIDALRALAPRLFRRTPEALLVFTQRTQL